MTSPGKLLKAWNLSPNKALGQNFLSDPSLSRKIVSLGGIGPEDVVLEIGSGLGSLTLPLAETAKFVLAIEKDTRLKELLKAELLVNGLSNVKLLEKNILEFDIADWAKGIDQQIIVAGNLPYNISSQILIQLIRNRRFIRKAIVMLQKETALRIIEKPGSRQYGRLSVMMQYCANVSRLVDIGADKFFPKPKIDSLVLLIEFKTHIDYPAVDESFLFKVIKAAFGQRRKTLRNALKGSELHITAETATTILETSKIDPARRAESLTVDEFVRLSNILKEVLEK